MSKDRKVKSHWNEASEINFPEMPSGSVLTKITAVDESMGEDKTVEVHGLLDEQGKLFITNVIVREKESDG